MCVLLFNIYIYIFLPHFLQSSVPVLFLYIKYLETRLMPDMLQKILKEMGMPEYPTCLLRNLYARQEVTVRTGRGKTDWFQMELGKGVCQGCILSP